MNKIYKIIQIDFFSAVVLLFRVSCLKQVSSPPHPPKKPKTPGTKSSAVGIPMDVREHIYLYKWFKNFLVMSKNNLST